MRDLTIIMPTYNKVRYIADALDSVFAQKTKYSYELVIADDCSTDGTLDVVARYEAEHPGVIRVLRSNRNQKLFRNVLRAYADLKTPYFCVLDPDDFWSSDRILQEALDFLSAHPGFTIYSSNCRLLETDGRERPYLPFETEVDSSFESFLEERGVIGQTAGLFYRNVLFANGLPDPLKGNLRPDQEMAFRGDAFRNFVHLHEGKAHFDPRPSATYRVTAEGLWQGMSVFRREVMNILLFLDLDEYFGFGDRALCTFIARRIASIRDRLPDLVATASDAKDAAECLSKLDEFCRRFRDMKSVPGRFASGLSVRNRLLFHLWRVLHRRARRKGWFPCA